jgi:hypothetical protein
VHASFPIVDTRTTAQRDARYAWFVEERPADVAFHYRLALPQNYRADQTPFFPPDEAHPYVCLARYRDQDRPSQVVQVNAALVPREIAPADWLETLFVSRELRVLERRRIPHVSGAVLDALTQGPDGISRWFAIKNAHRVFVVEARNEIEHDREAALDALIAVSTFEPTHKSIWPYAEQMRTYTRGLPGDFLVVYPYSWQLQETRADEHRSGLSIADMHDVVAGSSAGRITFVCSGSAGRPNDLLRPYIGSLAQRGLMAQLPPIERVDPIGGLTEVWAARGPAYLRTVDGEPAGLDQPPRDLFADPAILRDAIHEVHVHVGRREETWYLIALLTYARGFALPLAAINERAYEIMLTTMRTEPA